MVNGIKLLSVSLQGAKCFVIRENSLTFALRFERRRLDWQLPHYRFSFADFQPMSFQPTEIVDLL